MPENRPLLSSDSENRRALGHIFIIDFDHEGNLQAHISLFNQGMAYHVLLTQDPGGIDPQFASSHFFNPLNSQISEIDHIRFQA